MSQKVAKQPRDVFLFFPNLIGYGRVISAIVSFFIMDKHPIYFTFLYSISCLLDAVDGYAARRFNQSSKFGAVLDMVTDRCTTSALLCYLCQIYPKFTFIFQLLLSLDFASHYMHMYASLEVGADSHKTVTKESSRLLSLYYTNRKVLFVACFFNELFFLALYFMNFETFPSIFGYNFGLVIGVLTFPLWVFKQFTNVIQLNRAAVLLANIDAKNLNKSQ